MGDVQLRKLIEEQFDRKQDVLRAVPGFLGDGQGNVDAGGSMAYVRMANQVATVLNRRAPLINELPVWIGEDPLQPGTIQVLSYRETILDRSSSAPLIVNHGETHRYPNTDTTWIELEQFMPFRLVVSGLGLILYGRPVWTGSAYVDVPVTDPADPINIAAHIPITSDKAAWVLITISDTGSVVQTKGSEVDLADLGLDDIPAVPAGTRFVLAAVRVYYGQTRIIRSREGSDLLDLRYPLRHTHVAADLPSSMPPGTHGSAHVSTGSDPIPAVVAGSASGLMTGADKTKLDGIQAGAEVNVNADWNASSGDAQILNKPASMPPSAHTHPGSEVTSQVGDADTVDGQHASAFAPSSHTHGGGDITSAVANATNADTVDGQHATSFAPASHDHDSRYYTETELQTSGSSQVHWNNITNEPASYPPSAHTHAGSEITSQVSDADTVDGQHASAFAPAAQGVTNGNSHDHNDGDGGTIDHVNLNNKGTNTHAQIDTFIASKAIANGLASLSAGSLVVQNPANATSSPTASKIPISDANGKLDSWINDASTSVKGKVQLATNGESAASKAVQSNDSRLSDSRTPMAHANSHHSSGSDALALGSLAGSLTAAQHGNLSITAGSFHSWNQITAKPSSYNPSLHAPTHARGAVDEINDPLDPRAYPMLADIMANRPNPGYLGSFFFATDEGILYRDNGTGWDKVAVRDYDDLDGKPTVVFQQIVCSAGNVVVADGEVVWQS